MPCPFSSTTANVTLALGFLPALVGINSLLRPGHALQLLGFPAPTTEADRKVAHGLVRLSASRNLAMTLSTVAIFLTAPRKTLGYVMIAGAPIALIDGFVSRSVIEGMEWGHWIFVPISLGLGGKLAGFF